MITSHQEERPLHSSQSPITHTYSQAIQGQVHHQHTPPPDDFHPSVATSMLPFQHHPMDRHPQHMRQESVHVIHRHSLTPPAAISDQSHLRNSSAPYSHEMATPPFHFHHHHHHPAMYNGSYQGGEELMMNQHEHSTPLLPRPVVHAHPAAPPPSVLPPLLPPLLPQFSHPYLAQNPHRERGWNSSNHHHHQQQEGLHIGQSSSSIERDDDGSHRERHFSGQGLMHHLPASSHQQALPPLYPTIYGGGNDVPQDRIRGSPGYDSHRTSFFIPSPGHLFQADPHTSRHYSIQHSTASLDASCNEAGPSAIYTAPRHPESHTDRNGASPSAAGQSPTYQRRGSLLRRSESIIETSKEDLSSASPCRITPDQHRTPARQLKRNHHHHHAHASSPSKMGSPFIIGESGEQHSLFPGKKGNNPSRNQHHRRASIASTAISYHAARTDSIKASNAVMNDSSHLGGNEDHRQSSPNPPPLVEPSEGPHFPISTHPYPSSAAGGGGGNADPQQQPFLQYQPCLNPGCPNIYHYAQQIYQPTPTRAPAHSYASRYDSARSEMTTTFKLVEIPGMIQPPAWCELSPCGCTLCRDCFAFTITKCEISPPDISRGQYEPVRLFKCILCDAPAPEFGPINVKVQDVVESGKALFGGYPKDHLHQNNTLFETSYTQDDSETTFENTKDTANQSILEPRTIFEGFQSAQDVASGAHSNTITCGHVPSSNATKSEAGSSISIATSLLLPSPSKSGIRYARSDPPPSIPSLSPLIVPQRELDDMRADLTAPSESKTEPINDPLATITPNHPQAGGNRAEDIAALAKDAALVFPTLSGIETTTVPTRKVSTTSTIATSYDSPVFQTPDLGTCSSSSASTTALNSPEALHSPTVPLTSEGQAPWRQKALPEFHETKAVKTGDQRDDAQDKERQAKLDEDFKRLSVHAKKDESDGGGKVDVHAVGLGLTFGTVTPGKPVKTTAPTMNDSRTNEESLHIATPVSTPMRPPETPKPQALVSVSSVQKAPHRVPATPLSTRSAKVESTSPTSHIKSRAVSKIQMDRSPFRPPRGRGRGGILCPSVSHLGQEKHAHKPSSSTVPYKSARSRTDTQSSVQTASSSISGSSSSHGGLFSPNHRLHNRKVSMAENKSPRLPDPIQYPSDEMLRIWEENKARWWKDPWNGKLMGVKQKTVGVEKSMVKTDGSPLIRGKGAGISWPILKVHNIHFRTTIADIESFVPPGILAPLDHNAQGIHILCDATDGKTRPYAYVECISAAAAEHLIAVSDGQYLAGRQVAFRPVTQKELVLDLFRHVKRGGYYKSTILQEDPPTSKGSSHQRQHPYYDRAGDLELFTAEDDLQLRRLFDHTLPGSPESGDGNEVTKNESEPAMYFSFPIERPFARLASMIVKHPCHILVGPARTSEKQVQAIDRLFKCLLYAMEKLAPHSEMHPSLHAVLHRLYRAALQCPAFDERKEVLTEKWANFTGDENVYAI